MNRRQCFSVMTISVMVTDSKAVDIQIDNEASNRDKPRERERVLGGEGTQAVTGVESPPCRECSELSSV